MDDDMGKDRLRDELTGLRAWTPERDEDAHLRARAALQSRIDASSSAAGMESGSAEAVARRVPGSRERWRVKARLHRWLVGGLTALFVFGGAGTVAALLLHTKSTQQVPVFNSHGQLSSQFQVGSHGRGYCFTSSLATTDRNAYRCFEGNAIQDPCFAATPNSGSVACFVDPWSKVTLLKLTRKLPRNTNTGDDALPWAIVTTNGLRCVFLTGATAPMGGQRINYGCVGGAYLLGEPDQKPSLWTIRLARRYVPGDRAPLDSFPLVKIEQTIG